MSLYDSVRGNDKKKKAVQAQNTSPQVKQKPQELEVPKLRQVDTSAYDAALKDRAEAGSKYGSSLSELNEFLQKDTRTPEEIEAERKKGKRRAVVNAIFDGLSSIANLGTVAAGAKSVYDPSQSLSARSLGKWEKKKKEYDARRAAALKAKSDMLANQYKIASDAAEGEGKRLEGERRKNLDAFRIALDLYKSKVGEKQAREKMEEAKRHNIASESISRTRASKSGSGSGSDSYEKKVAQQSDLDKIFNKLDENARRSAGNTSGLGMPQKPTYEQKQSAIAEYVAANPNSEVANDYADYVQKYAGKYAPKRERNLNLVGGNKSKDLGLK